MASFFKSESTLGEITPAPDGVTLEFTITNSPTGDYTPGTLATFVNGNEESVEVTESDPSTAKFSFAPGCAPKTGAILVVHAFDTAPDSVVIRATICATVGDDGAICGAIDFDADVDGTVGDTAGVSGTITEDSVTGSVTQQSITAVVKEC